MAGQWLGTPRMSTLRRQRQSDLPAGGQPGLRVSSTTAKKKKKKKTKQKQERKREEEKEREKEREEKEKPGKRKEQRTGGSMPQSHVKQMLKSQSHEKHAGVTARGQQDQQAQPTLQNGQYISTSSPSPDLHLHPEPCLFTCCTLHKH